MASRTSAGFGMMLSLSIFALLSLVLFVTTIVFVAKVQRLNNDLLRAQNDLADAIRPNERGDRWEELKRQSGGQGVVTSLDASIRETMRLASGSERDTLDSFKAKIKNTLGENAPPLLEAVRERESRIGSLQSEMTRETQARERIENELRASNERLAELQKKYDEAISEARSTFSTYSANIDDYRSELDDTLSRLLAQVTSIRTESDQTIGGLETTINELQSTVLILQDQLGRARGEQRRTRLSPRSEDTLVDGRVIGVNAPARQIFIDRGRRDRMVLGLTFEVFDSGTQIAPDADGNYPTGKATIEVIRIEDGSSVGRIIREIQGNPIINGDVIVNALYDANKEYVFTVFGNFDANRDGIATAQEREEVRALIERWGGHVEDDLTGHTDFLVLGTRAVLPPEPKPEDPPELIQRFLRLKQASRRYDELFDAAVKTGIPVLNENRLLTLSGRHAER